MIRRVISKIISVAILSIFIGLLAHVYHVKGGQMGRDAFLAKEAARYDRFFAHPDPIIVDVISVLLLTVILFAAYELVAFVTLKVLEQIKINADEVPYGNSHQN